MHNKQKHTACECTTFLLCWGLCGAKNTQLKMLLINTHHKGGTGYHRQTDLEGDWLHGCITSAVQLHCVGYQCVVGQLSLASLWGHQLKYRSQLAGVKAGMSLLPN